MPVVVVTVGLAGVTPVAAMVREALTLAGRTEGDGGGRGVKRAGLIHEETCRLVLPPADNEVVEMRDHPGLKARAGAAAERQVVVVPVPVPVPVPCRCRCPCRRWWHAARLPFPPQPASSASARDTMINNLRMSFILARQVPASIEI